MAAIQHNPEKKKDSENNSDELESSIATGLLSADRMKPSKQASARISVVLFGELHTLALNSDITIMKALNIYKPIVRLRQFYKCQDIRPVAYYWVEVQCSFILNLLFCYHF